MSFLPFFFKSLNDSELHWDLSPNSQQWEKHTLIESKSSFFRNGFFDGMNKPLIVLLWLRDHLDFDVFEGQHTDNLPPTGHTPTEEIFAHLIMIWHVTFEKSNVVKLMDKTIFGKIEEKLGQ
mgnify:CR=1 FL=1